MAAALASDEGRSSMLDRKTKLALAVTGLAPARRTVGGYGGRTS